MDKFIVGFGSTPREYVINGVRYVVESRFQKPDYKKPRENTLLNNRIGNYLTSDFADFPAAVQSYSVLIILLVPTYGKSAKSLVR